MFMSMGMFVLVVCLMPVTMTMAGTVGMHVFVLMVGIITVDLYFSGAAAACGAHSCLRLPTLLRVP
jgi:hypothetical protein